MAPPDRPPGRGREGGPRHASTSRPTPDPATRLGAEGVIHRLQVGGVNSPEARARAALLALSDERDAWLSRVLGAERDGYRRGERTGYGRGYLDGIAARKHAQHLLVDVIGAHLARWDGLRADFGKPRPGDYLGGPIAWDGGQRS